MDRKDLKPGTYPARTRLFAWDTDRNGEVCLNLLLTLVDCEAEGIEVEGKLYFDTSRVDAKGRTAADRSMEVLHAMGLPGGTLESIDLRPEDGGGINDGLVSVVVEITDKGYPVARYINVPNGGRGEVKVWAPPAPDVKAAFFAKMRALSGGTAPAPRPQAPAPAPARANGNPPAQRPAPVTGFGAPIAGEDDIPF
jgi:hypothetical protein